MNTKCKAFTAPTAIEVAKLVTEFIDRDSVQFEYAAAGQEGTKPVVFVFYTEF